jgi:hypothetical protein
MRRTLLTVSVIFSAILVLATNAMAQSRQPYPKAVTDQLIHEETPMSPPAAKVPFVDPDFGSRMVRVTDATTDFLFPGTSMGTEASGEQNMWSADGRKFYVIGKGGRDFAFGFDPSSMAISPLPSSEQELVLPLRPGATFSFVDPDLIYGTVSDQPLTISSYRFSTAVTTPVIDTATCGTQPALVSGRGVVSDDDVSLSLDDSRLSISEGGPESGKHMFLVVYDKNLGCRWYNTLTGQIGGQWGEVGLSTALAPYLIRHAYLSKSGNYVLILVNWFGWYVWDLSTLNVSACEIGSGMNCAGYGSVGYDTLINSPGIVGGMQVEKRPLSNLSQFAQLVYPLPSPGYWGQPQHFTWGDVDANDSAPICGSTYSYDGDTEIDQPYAGEIFCVETDGLSSTVWRFAHNRAVYIEPYFNTQPLGNVSRDGRFFIFTSDWDAQLGVEPDGRPVSHVFIVSLD